MCNIVHLIEEVADSFALRVIAQHLEGIALCGEVLLGQQHLRQSHASSFSSPHLITAAAQQKPYSVVTT